MSSTQRAIPPTRIIRPPEDLLRRVLSDQVFYYDTRNIPLEDPEFFPGTTTAAEVIEGLTGWGNVRHEYWTFVTEPLENEIKQKYAEHNIGIRGVVLSLGNEVLLEKTKVKSIQ